MELRLNEPDFLLRVVQMIRSLKRKSERSFLPPTDFCRKTWAAQNTCTKNSYSFSVMSVSKTVFFNHLYNYNLFPILNQKAPLTASMTISCLKNFLWGFRIWHNTHRHTQRSLNATRTTKRIVCRSNNKWLSYMLNSLDVCLDLLDDPSLPLCLLSRATSLIDLFC